MPLHILRNDITKMQVDAIVSAADPALSGSGGTESAIRIAAGPALEKAVRELGGCRPGAAKITWGFNLPCRYVIHTAGPIWRGGFFGERRILASCYKSALSLAVKYGCRSVAVPVISSGSFGYPRESALDAAVIAIRSFLDHNNLTVYLVLFDRETTSLGRNLSEDLQEYIDDNYADTNRGLHSRMFPRDTLLEEKYSRVFLEKTASPSGFPPQPPAVVKRSISPRVFGTLASPTPSGRIAPSLSLDDLYSQIDESFQQMLLRKIDEAGMTDAECYKKANVDRKLFSKIRKDVHYKPSKPTAIAFAVALELNLRETEDLLQKAGFALSRSSIFDLIIRYYIERSCFDIYEINEALYRFDQSLLGA